MKKLWPIKMMAILVFYYRYAAATDRKTYIIHMEKSVMPSSFSNHFDWYESSVRSVTESIDMLYTYSKVIHGFSARLAVEEAELLEQRHGVLSVQEEETYELHTTRSPEFLGLGRSEVMSPESRLASDVIVGVADTGVWPGSKSLDDMGLGPVPARWKGECEAGTNFGLSSCNKKLIGARYFSRAYEAIYGPIDETIESKSPMDDDGHGTHTSTTAAGSPVVGASLFNFAKGTARGMAPHARLAVYKICWLGGCLGSDILAAMDKAIEDGVDVLSLSIGGSVSDYTKDIVAIGAFNAMSNGVFVACSAGNSGPTAKSLSNVAPWIATVGAGTLDRDFPAYVTLGNGKIFSGVSLYNGKPLSDLLVALVYAGKISNTTTGNLCTPGSLPNRSVAGKIVVCDRGLGSRVQKGIVVKAAGGLGMILANTYSYGEELVADAHFIPSSAVGQRAGDAIKRYITADSNPTATIASGGTRLGIQPSPLVAAFSSRGPNQITQEILKPDFIAPGVNILAGWTNKIGPSGLRGDPRHVEFNIVSGTSMSCPHISGLAALLKAIHPEWSPAAIRSALMTTAYTTYKNGGALLDVTTGMPSTPFDHGAGHVDPVSALDPGLVYDASEDDYLSFLCALNYSSNAIKMLAKRDFSCMVGKKYKVEDLNYPSFAVPLVTASGEGGGGHAQTVVRYTRRLTNVGAPAIYKVAVSSKTRAVKITVEPEVLSFIRRNDTKIYTVTFTASSMPSGTTSFARLAWLGGKYVVSSPIAFSWT